MRVSRAGTAALSLVLLLSLVLPAINVQPVSADATYVVNNTLDNEDPGSVRWAIRSANAAPAGGKYTITFNIPTSDPGYYTENATSHWWRILINDPLPTVNRANVYIDGSSQPGNTNPGQVGTGGTVGAFNDPFARYDRPEIEITPKERAHTSIGFQIAADNVTIRGMAIYGFGGEGASISNAQVRIGSNGYRATIENCLIGVRANGADPGFDSKSSGISISNMTSGTVKNNYIGNNIMGIYFSNASNWTISGNEIFQNGLRYSSYDGMDLASGTNNISVTGNLIRQNGGTGIDSYSGAGTFTIANNTVTKSGAAGGSEKGGVRIYGSGSRVTGNILTENGGPGIIVPPLFGTIYSENNTISQNSCYSNGGLGIDLVRLGGSAAGDGVNFNDGIFIDTWGNRGIDFPILTAAGLAGNNLNLAGYVGTDNTSVTFSGCKLEFFTAATDPTGYGEGRTYLGSYVMASANNSFICTLDVSGKGLVGTESITATATAAGSKKDTSEFSLCRQLSTTDNPVLSLNVTPPAYGYAGQSVTYSGSVRNVSASTAYNNALTWQLPAEFTYVSSSGGVYNPATRSVTITVPTITAGQEITGYVTVQINSNVPDGTIVTTGSRLTWQDLFGNPLGPVDHSSSIVVYATPQLTTQLFPPTYAFAGENVIYTGVLHNYSSGTAVNTVLKFQLPAGMSFVSASRAAIVSGDNVTFNLGNIAPNTDMTGSMTVLIDGATPDGTVLQMVTLLSWYDAAGNYYGPQQRFYDLTVYQRPQLTITKEGPPDAVIGSTYKFTGTLTNTGSGPAKNIELIDYLPVGLTFVSSSHSAVYDVAARKVTWQLGSLSSGNSIPGWITVLVDNATPSGSRFINNFQATWTDNLSIPYGPVSASKEITAYSNPQLTITKEGPDEATVGSYITFTGSLSNVGGLPAENTVLVDYLPAGLNYVGSSQSAVYDPVTRTVTWQIGHVASGAAMPGWLTVQVDSSVPNGARLTNTFGVTWKDGSGNTFGPANADKQVIARTNPLLSISKSGPVYGRPGGNLTFTININNIGGLNAQNITLVDSLPDKYSYVSSNPPGAYSGGNVIWNLGSLAPGAGTSVSLTVLVAAATTNNTPLANTAMVTWKDGAGNTYGPTSTSFITTIYSTPKLIVTKTGPATANPGDNCTYIIEIVNVADHDALNTAVADIIPSRMSYVSSNPVGDNSTGPVIWMPGTIAANSARTFSVTLHVDHSLTQDTVLTDTAMANWEDEFGEVYGPGSGSCSTSVTPFPELSVLLAGPSSGQVGAALTFTVRVTNNSDTMAANNVMAQFVVPSGCSYTSSSDGGSYAGGAVTWSLGSLAPLGSRQVTIVITVTTAPSGSDVISTSATAWQYPSGTPHGPKFATAGTTILPAPPVPPPSPTPEASPLDRMPIAPHSSGTVNTVTNPPPMQMPFIYIESAYISASQVEPNSPVRVTATIANKGTVNGSSKIRLYVNGYEEPGQGLTLASGQSRTLTFDVSRSEPGTYQVYVNGTSAGSFKVSDNSGSNAILIMSTLCLLGALFIGILMVLRRRQSQY
jgi:uncharacterized repeat protein (TIGR01451 family)